jgi:hypothetical protein
MIVMLDMLGIVLPHLVILSSSQTTVQFDELFLVKCHQLLETEHVEPLIDELSQIDQPLISVMIEHLLEYPEIDLGLGHVLEQTDELLQTVVQQTMVPLLQIEFVDLLIEQLLYDSHLQTYVLVESHEFQFSIHSLITLLGHVFE